MNVITKPRLQKVVDEKTSVARQRAERLIVLKLPVGELLQLLNRANDELKRRLSEAQSSGLSLVEAHTKINYEGHRAYREALSQLTENQIGRNYLVAKDQMDQAIQNLEEAEDAGMAN